MERGEGGGTKPSLRITTEGTPGSGWWKRMMRETPWWRAHKEDHLGETFCKALISD